MTFLPSELQRIRNWVSNTSGFCRDASRKLSVFAYSYKLENSLGTSLAKRGFGGATHVYTFSSAGLEILEAARAHGIATVVELPLRLLAIDFEQEIMEQEHSK